MHPACPKCGGNGFGIEEINVENANFRHYAVFCKHCGSIVGTETMQDDARTNNVLQSLGSVSRQVLAISSEIRRIVSALRLKGLLI